MATRRFWYWTAAAVFVAAGFHAGVAGAQSAQRAASGGGAAELRADRRANLSGPEQLRESATILQALQGSRRQIAEMLDRARTQDRDIIKVNCLSDKLSQLDLTLRSAQEHRELLETAVRINNDGQRNHEYNLLVIFRQRADGIEGEARQCIGEEAGGFGERQAVTMTVANTIPTEETDQLPALVPALEIPPTASPIR